MIDRLMDYEARHPNLFALWATLWATVVSVAICGALYFLTPLGPR